MKKQGLIIIIIILLVVGMGLLINKFYFSNSQPETNISDHSVQEKKDEASTKLEQAAITLFSEDGTTKWELKAEEIKQFEDSSRVALQQITAEVYEQGSQLVSLTAAEGEADTKTGFLSLDGPITVQNEERMLKTDKLNWNEAKNQLTGRGNVVLEKPGVKITADSFITQMNLRKVRLKGNVRAIYTKAGDQGE